MKIKLRNKIAVLMRDSGIDTFEDMSRRLADRYSIHQSRTSISRKFRQPDASLSISLIEALCNEFQCLPGDLFETEITEVNEDFVAEIRSRLQPFRYGAIHFGTAPASKGKGVKAPSSPTSENLSRESTDEKHEEHLFGPSVSHLHVGKLKKK